MAGKQAKTKRIQIILVVVAAIILAPIALYAGKRLINHFRPEPLLMAGEDHSVPPIPDAYRMPDPLGPVIHDVRTQLTHAQPLPATGINRGEYIRLIGGIVRHFRHLQLPTGEIIDPYKKYEIQYSTPNFALAAAVLIDNGQQDLLGSAMRALEVSLSDLARHRAAGKTGDFYILPAMMAYERLRGRVDADTRKRWEGYLRRIDPDKAYSDRIGPGQPDVMNWNANAISGEYLRHRDGFTDLAFVDRYVDAQLPRFTPEGLYRDPATPLVYDAAARFNFMVLLQEGYRGPGRAAIETLVHRGAWASLLMQSPGGDFPIGGRSGGHLWNDALQTALFELSATRAAARGDTDEAASFKRAAHLAAGSVARWVRPSGGLWVVQNHFNPARRFGYEDYSDYSQYNLLTAGYLALAWSYASEAIPEGPTPAETGNFVIELPRFRKVFANFDGRFLEIDTGADIEHNDTGLLRLVTRDDKAAAFGGGLATGAGWQRGAKRETLAGLSAGRVNGELVSQSGTDKGLRFSIRYRPSGAGVKQIVETYTLDDRQVRVDTVVDGPVDKVIVRFPAFMTDGRDSAAIEVNGRSLTMRARGAVRRFTVSPPASALVRAKQVLRDKSGFYVPYEAQASGNHISYSLGWN